MAKRLAAVICAYGLIASCGEPMETKQLETPRGTIQYKETISDRNDFNDRLQELSPEQRVKIASALAQVEPFIRRYVPREKRSPDLLENLDQAFENWMTSTDQNKESAEHVIDVVGSGFGNYCIERLDVRWMSAMDETGTELALTGEDPPTRAYPFASVRYRIEDGKVDFVGALFEALKHQRENN